MTASLVVVLPIVVLFFVLQRYFVEGIALTGLKGKEDQDCAAPGQIGALLP